MQALLRFSLARPGATLVFGLVLTALLGAGMLRLELRTDGEALRPIGHAWIERDALDRARFRDPRDLLLVVEATPSAPLTTPAGFRRLRDLHYGLRRLDVLRPGGIVSVAGLPRLDRDGGGVGLGRQLDRVPDDAAGFEALLAEIRARPRVEGLLLSADGRRALFALPLSETASVIEAVRALEDFCARESGEGIELLLGGPLVAETTLGERVLRDLVVLVPAMLVVIVALLFALLRSPGGVLVPMFETLVVLIWTFGAMGWAGAPIALVTTVLPVVLMAMCIADEIHLLERYTRPSDEAPRVRLEHAFSELGRPLVLTSLTTAAGFLSFTATSIGPLRDFGVFAAFGIVVAMLLTFSLIPAVIVLLPERAFVPIGRRLERAPAPGDRALAAFGRVSVRRPGLLFGVAVAALLLLLPGLPRLAVSDSWVENFAADSAVVRVERAIGASFWGSYRLDVVLEGAPGTFYSPEGLALLARVAEAARTAPHVGGVETLRDPLADASRAFDGERPLDSLSQRELWDLFTLLEMVEGGAGLEQLVAGRGAAARVRLYVRNADYRSARELVDALEASLPPLIGPAGPALHLSGDLAVATVMVEAIVENQLRSIGWAILTVAILLVVFTRRAGSVRALVPALAATVGLLGAMGLLGIRLGIATSMFASLAVGVGVDFGIHFQHRFERAAAGGLDRADALLATFSQAGRALLWNAIVLGAGFAVLAASSLKPNHSLGLLLSTAVLACFAATFLLLPWLLRVRSAAGAAIATGILLTLAGTRADAAPADCALPADPAATRLMAEIEARVRGVARIQRMEIETRYQEGTRLAEVLDRPDPKILWGVIDGGVQETWLLFVFSGPGRMAGTSLLLQDFRGASRDDATWFYLSAFERFHRLEGGVERSVVPGTALTYEDARGFVAGDRYTFHRLPDPEADARRILACPRTPEVADRLGYAALVIDVDPGRRLVTHIDYRGLGGGPLKRYELLEHAAFAGDTFPTRVRLVHAVDGFSNDIRVEYWPPRAPLPRELFRPETAQRTFLERLRALLHANGLGPRIDAEIAEADARVRAWEERWER